MRSFESLTTQGRARRLRVTAAEAAERYGIDLVDIRQMAIDTNVVFRLTDRSERRVALRIARPGLHQPIDTALEVWFVRQLAEAGCRVADVVANTDGEYVTEVPATDIVPAQRCVMFEWLDGTDADESKPAFWTALGEAAAEIHGHAATLQVPATFRLRQWDSVFPYEAPVLFEDRYADLITAEFAAVLRDGIAALDEQLAALAARDGATHMLHGDLHDGNVRWQGTTLGVFDFEDHIVGHPHHDLAVALYGPYFSSDDFPGVVATLRAGYERRLPWPIEDIDELRPLWAARALGMVNFVLPFGDRYAEFIPTLVERVRRYVATT